ncbi:hypothetical protein QUB56_14400 [Microcoleus sp. AR_TQ3_B6]|uniref:hypothetical protein n=1 Tax=Microcoleus sp. AR_TQ3_B6 TaxID=3055284 RepID=UPI002FD2217F
MGSIDFSFRYYIDPGVWRFFHTIAEIVETKRPEQQKAFLAATAFKDFFTKKLGLKPRPSRTAFSL